MSSTAQDVNSEIMQQASMRLINAIKQNNQEEVFELLKVEQNLFGNRIVDGVDLQCGGNPVYWAAVYGHAHFIPRLVEMGADVNRSDNNARTPVWIAAQNGHANTIAVLKEAGANMDMPNNDDETPVYIAAYNGRINAIIALKVADANIDTPDIYDATPVWVAAQNGYANTIAILKEMGANVDTPNAGGATPVWVAAQNRHSNIITILKNAGANVDTPDINGATPVYIAAENGYPDTIAALKGVGANVNTPDSDGETPVYVAAYNGQIDAIIALKTAGANVNTPDNDGKTPVYIAAENGHAEAITTLKDVGANVDTPDNDSRTPVYIAAYNGQIDAIIALKVAGANVDTPDVGGATPVWAAAQNGHAEAITVLKNAGANLNTADSDDKTPIYIAAEMGSVAAITALLEAGADASIPTEWGTALECARQGKKPEHLEVVRVLEEHFQQYPNGIKAVDSLVFIHLSDLKTRDFIEAIKQNNQAEVFRLLYLFGKRIVDALDVERKGSPLYWAAAYGHAHFITPLVEVGADLNKADKRGKTPVFIAAQNGHVAAVSALLKAGADASIRTQWGTALDRAGCGITSGHLEVVRVLKAHLYPNKIKPVMPVKKPLIFGKREQVEKKVENEEMPLRNLDELENAINLPSQAEIQAYAKEQGIPLIMSKMPKLGVIHDHESQKFQKHPETKVENEGIPESNETKPVDSPVFIHVDNDKHLSDLNTKDFIEAIKKNNQAEVFRLLQLFGKKIVDEVDMEREGSALYWAAACGHVHFITPLIDAGADVNKSDKNGKTPVFIAAQNGHAAAVSALLAAGVDASIPTQWGTALGCAKQGKKSGHLEVIRVLEAHFQQYPNGLKKEHGTSVRIDKSGTIYDDESQKMQQQVEKKVENEVMAMSLIEAIKQNNREEVLRLLHLKTNPFGKRVVDELDVKREGSPLYWAAAYGHVHFIALLVEAGVDVNKADKYGCTPVYIAADNNKIDAIIALKIAGANVDTPDNGGKTPIHIAAGRGDTKTIFALRMAGAAKVVTELEEYFKKRCSKNEEVSPSSPPTMLNQLTRSLSAARCEAGKPKAEANRPR